jgi:hypothetical protein
MTEEEWLASGDPIPMADFALNSARATNRVNRLFVAEFWAWQATRVDEQSRPSLSNQAAQMAMWAESGRFPKPGRPSRSRRVIFFNVDSGVSVRMTASGPRHWQEPWKTDALAIQSLFLRDIFGNPFRPVAVDPGWLTSSVVELARGIYDQKAFDRLPILADALQDAGCDHPDVLAHCRGPGPHVRGCWVVDLVLGKT